MNYQKALDQAGQVERTRPSPVFPTPCSSQLTTEQTWLRWTEWQYQVLVYTVPIILLFMLQLFCIIILLGNRACPMPRANI